jgi:ribosomal protein S18 acetylase RimI-like enzyme
MPEVGDIRLAAYQADGFISADSGYASTLHGLGADGKGHVLVAVLPDEDLCAAGSPDRSGSRPGSTQGRIAGTIMLQTWPDTGQVVQGADEAEIRALAVRPHAQGQGIGADLLRRLIDLAAGKGVRRLVLCTEAEMRPAHRLYERAGFERQRERDWSPAPGTTLLVYSLQLEDCAAER